MRPGATGGLLSRYMRRVSVFGLLGEMGASERQIALRWMLRGRTAARTFTLSGRKICVGFVGEGDMQGTEAAWKTFLCG